ASPGWSAWAFRSSPGGWTSSLACGASPPLRGAGSGSVCKGASAMSAIPPSVAQDEERLGALAMKFRGTRRESERRDLARDYAQTVDRLIASGNWHEMPAFEDHLPDDWMPTAFFEYWLRQQGAP